MKSPNGVLRMFGFLALVSALVGACSKAPELLEWNPIGCYAIAFGESSRWMNPNDFRATTINRHLPTFHLGLQQRSGDMEGFDGPVLLPYDFTGHSGWGWVFDRPRVVRAYWAPVEGDGSEYTLASIRRDTIDGFRKLGTGLFRQRTRVRGLRILCADTTFKRTSSGLQYLDIKSYKYGKVARPGMDVTIHEVATLMDGTVIFDSRKNNTPITFTLGANQVIKGVDEGVTDMRVTEKRRLIVPPSLIARNRYPANTPKDSTLKIEIELLNVKSR